METTQINKVLSFVDNWEVPKDDSSIRKEALATLAHMDFPTTRVEDWKYTRTTRITNKEFHQSEILDVNINKFRIPNLEAHQLVFVNGYFRNELSSILKDEGLEIKTIQELDENLYADTLEDTEENVFSLINKAYSTSGTCINFKKNKKADYPVHILHVVSGENVVSNVRHFVSSEFGSKGEVITSFHSLNANDCFVNAVIEGNVAENANLNITQLQLEEQTTFHIFKEQFVQEKNSNLEINTVTLGSLLTRNGINILVDGENCHSELNGVYLGKNKQHLDTHTFIDHLYGHCTSSETYKGVMNDQSTGVFNGKVIVRQDAQKIEAYQSNGNILLSPKASVNSKPELEIYADDVRCSHGSTTGQLDEDAVFYLRARGISEVKAKELLVVAFISEVLEKIKNESVLAYIQDQLVERLNWEF